MVAVLQLPIISCLVVATYSSLSLTFIAIQCFWILKIQLGWVYIMGMSDISDENIWSIVWISMSFNSGCFPSCVSYPPLYVLICLPLDDSHQYLITLGWCWQFIEKDRCKDTVCVLCIISMVIMDKGLKLSYTFWWWPFNVTLTSTGHKKPLHLHMDTVLFLALTCLCPKHLYIVYMYYFVLAVFLFIQSPPNIRIRMGISANNH